jgi:membrane protease YdiL (CAAX protease family)
MLLVGTLFVGAGIVKYLRNKVVWILGVTVYAVFSILSIAQIRDYSASAGFSRIGIYQTVVYSGSEESLGLIGAVIGFLIISCLLTPRARAFFFRGTALSRLSKPS